MTLFAPHLFSITRFYSDRLCLLKYSITLSLHSTLEAVSIRHSSIWQPSPAQQIFAFWGKLSEIFPLWKYLKTLDCHHRDSQERDQARCSVPSYKAEDPGHWRPLSPTDQSKFSAYCHSLLIDGANKNPFDANYLLNAFFLHSVIFPVEKNHCGQ